MMGALFCFVVAFAGQDPSDDVESPPTDEIVDVDAPPTDEIVDVKSPSTDEIVDVDAPPTDEIVDVDARPTDEIVDVESPPSDEIVDEERPAHAKPDVTSPVNAVSGADRLRITAASTAIPFVLVGGAATLVGSVFASSLLARTLDIQPAGDPLKPEHGVAVVGVSLLATWATMWITAVVVGFNLRVDPVLFALASLPSFAVLVLTAVAVVAFGGGVAQTFNSANSQSTLSPFFILFQVIPMGFTAVSALAVAPLVPLSLLAIGVVAEDASPASDLGLDAVHETNTLPSVPDPLENEVE